MKDEPVCHWTPTVALDFPTSLGITVPRRRVVGTFQVRVRVGVLKSSGSDLVLPLSLTQVSEHT